MRGASMTKEQFTSVSDLVNNISGDQEFNSQFQERINARRIIKSLVALRVSKGISQVDIAKEIGCGQSRVSKLENSFDDDLRIGDMRAYLKAMDCGADVLLANRHATLFERVKCHAFGMRDAFMQLAKLAQKDEQMAKGVAYGHVEALMNVAKMLQDTLNELPVCPDNGKPYVRISDCAVTVEDDPNITCHLEDTVDNSTDHAIA